MHNYRRERRWLEIIKRPPKEKKEEETPTERLRKELEESLRVEKEIVAGLLKKEDVNKIIPSLNGLLLDELDAIAKYGELLLLLKRIVVATGLLEKETMVISKILEDEMRHESEIRRTISELGGG